MLSISVPSKFALSFNSLPPFFLETILAFVLVVLLAVPLVARVQMLLENPVSYFSTVTWHNHKFNHQLDDSIMATSTISVNLQLDTIRPIDSSSSAVPNLNNTDANLIHPNCGDLITSKRIPSNVTNDYDYYRHQLVGLNLRRQFGGQAPAHVVLNSHHLNTIDSRTIVRLNGKYDGGLFDFVECPEPNEKIRWSPVEHFVTRPAGKSVVDKSVDTEQNDQDRVPELIDFRVSTPKTRRRKSGDTAVSEKPRHLQVSGAELAPPREEFRPSLKPKHKKRTKNPDGNERSSIACPSVASSEALSLNSSASRQPEKPAVGSRPTSSCGSTTRGFKNFKPRINSRPRSGGCYGWDIPDAPKSPTGDATDSPNAPDLPVTGERDSAAQNTDEKMHKSRLPVRQVDVRQHTWRNSEIDRTTRVARVDTASQVSLNSMDNSPNFSTQLSTKVPSKSPTDEIDKTSAEADGNQKLENTCANSKENGEPTRTASVDSMRPEINTPHQFDQTKSLLEKSEVSSCEVKAPLDSDRSLSLRRSKLSQKSTDLI